MHTSAIEDAVDRVEEVLENASADEPAKMVATFVVDTDVVKNGYHGLVVLDEVQAQCVQIVYGGSVKAENAQALFSMPDIDGGLVGGASLNADEFGAIARAAGQV